MLAQKLQIHREVSHQSRLQAVLIKVIQVWHVRRHTLSVLVRIEPRNERGLRVAGIEEGHAFI